MKPRPKYPCAVCGLPIDARNRSRHARTHGDPRDRLAVPRVEQEEMVRLYGRHTIAEIAAITFWSHTEVHRVLTANGVRFRSQIPRRNPQITSEEVLRRCELYGRGYSLTEVAEMRGVTPTAIAHTLRRAGTPTRSPSEAQRLAHARGRRPAGVEAA